MRPTRPILAQSSIPRLRLSSIASVSLDLFACDTISDGSAVDRVSQPFSSGYFTTSNGFYNDNRNAINDSVTQIAEIAKGNVNIKAVEDHIRNFAESSKVLMKMLDEVAKVHPFIGVAVLAFKAVVTLELKRRENDRKVIALKVEMKEMMSVLLELRYVKDSRQPLPDDTTIEGRMEGLMKQIANDITTCGNLCDTYTKKSLVAKVFKGPIWEIRLAEFADIFLGRRKEIALALSIHTTLAVDSANRMLTDLREDIDTVHDKLDMLLVFKQLEVPLPRDFSRIVSEVKGPTTAWVDNDDVLQRLISASRGSKTSAKDSQQSAPTITNKSSKMATADPKLLMVVRSELQEDMEQAIADNMELFSRKLKVQEKQLIEQLNGVVHREGDRIISAVVSGPHDRLLDPDLHKLWKEMGWKGSVKASHFILALHDYFVDKFREVDEQFLAATPPSAMVPFSPEEGPCLSAMLDIAFPNYQPRGKQDDRWTLDYVNISRIQSIMESFDVDGSGFINIYEANSFTDARPKSWSFPHWLAYWAAGWHSITWEYTLRIKRVIQTMYDQLPEVLSANRSMVDQYLECGPLLSVELLCSSVRECEEEVYQDGLLDEKIRPYMEEEQERIEGNLKSVAYSIDATNTLTLVVGQGRIERYVFPLLYLLLKQHLRIIKLASQGVFSGNPLLEAGSSLEIVMSSVYLRVASLVAHFDQKGLNASTQLETVAFGMFKLLHDEQGVLELEEDRDSSYDSDSENISEEIDPCILKNGFLDREADWSKYDDVDLEFDRKTEISSNGIPAIHGVWTGLYSCEKEPKEDSFYISLRSGDEDGSIVGEGADFADLFYAEGTLETCDDGGYQVTITKNVEESELPAVTFRGKLDTTAARIEGKWGVDEDEVQGAFHLAMAPPFTLTFRYARQEYHWNRARARWRFALEVTLYKIRRSSWSWDYFKSRRKGRKRFIELWRRRQLVQLWSVTFDEADLEDESRELDDLEACLSLADLAFYQSLAQSSVRRAVVHAGVYCDSCSATMLDTRIICLECVASNYRDQVDLCFSCISMETMNENFTHERTHPMVKVQAVIHRRSVGSLIRYSVKATERANDMLRLMAERRATSADEAAHNSNDTEEPLDETFDRYCINCEELISAPCWYCVTCDMDVFICDECDLKKLFDWKHGHSHEHPLVRCQEPSKPLAEDSTTEAGISEARLSEVEHNITTLGERLANLEVTMEKQQAVINQRFSTLEDLLKQVISRLPSNPLPKRHK
ncbi:hypothetical protein BJ138DRAFT_1010091 [Hygrophoropsis aurantiaca]|uniref:Uncharacterized protein n=1 Tax=Hygrophoropsis aurantiaca TaxID=72124 RepID=A0ACB8AAW0_9AGAM|nr:hypothetical protein BJ138DRAFT_1010091 [Hygrophoropsis aurantiaca]